MEFTVNELHFSSFAEVKDMLIHTCQNVQILDIHLNKRGDKVFVSSSKKAVFSSLTKLFIIR